MRISRVLHTLLRIAGFCIATSVVLMPNLANLPSLATDMFFTGYHSVLAFPSLATELLMTSYYAVIALPTATTTALPDFFFTQVMTWVGLMATGTLFAVVLIAVMSRFLHRRKKDLNGKELPKGVHALRDYRDAEVRIGTFARWWAFAQDLRRRLRPDKRQPGWALGHTTYRKPLAA